MQGWGLPCYSVNAMSKDNTKPNKNIQRAAAILEEHLATLTPVQEKKARKELHDFATRVFRRSRARIS
jgi:hypothetical protein